MKAIILTYAGVSKEEKKLLQETNIFKIACNDYCAELKPNVRLTADNIVDKCLKCDTCPVISVNYDLTKERVINGSYLPNRHSSLLFCIDYLYLKGYDDVLLVATNPPGTNTHKLNLEGTDFMKDCFNLYKYSEEGTFNLPIKTVKEFLMLTEEEKLLGLTEPKERTFIERTIFTDACKYEVYTQGRDNKSIESGKLIGDMLPFKEKQRFLNGESEIIYNGLVIRKLTALVPKKEEVKEEVKADKLDVDAMTYQELAAYAKEHNIKSKTNKKVDLIEAIKDSING